MTEQLIERLTRMIAEPGWQRYYMDKDEAAICLAALTQLPLKDELDGMPGMQPETYEDFSRSCDRLE